MSGENGNGRYDPSNRKLLEEMHDKISKLYTVVLGVESTDDKGLVGKVNKVCNAHDKLAKLVWILVALLVGGGVISGIELSNLAG